MNKIQILSDLDRLISFQSISAQKSKQSEIVSTVSYLSKKLKNLGCSVSFVKKGSAPPLIIAELKIPEARKTIGIYGHYDVQPEDPREEWLSDPFQLTIKKGKMYARGVADNKGHIIQNISAMQMLVESRKLSNNVVFLFEGEEETGSENLEIQIREKKEELRHIDVFFITDSGMFKKNVPQIEYALRGLVYFEIEVSIGTRDLHSGLYGNAAINPINILSHLLSSMKDLKTGKVLIPGFYDDVRTVGKQERSVLSKIKLSDAELKEEMNSYGVTTVKGFPAYLAPKIQPSMDVHGIMGGFIGEGPKTVIPRSARAKFSFRLVEHQDQNTIEKQIQSFIKKNLPAGVNYNLTVHSKDAPFYTSLDNHYIQTTAKILSEHFGHQTVFNRSGGSIPAAEIIQRILKKPVVLTGFTLPDENIHAPNENMDEEMFWEGIEALQKVYSNI